MKIIETEIPEILILEPKVFRDERGFFYESYNERTFRKIAGRNARFVQDNHSRSVRGVLRGLHYQLPPAAQGKLVRCVVGEVFDVAVDIRKGSPTLGKWVGARLSAENKRQMWIPEGFAHGFLVLSEVAEFLYKTTCFYQPEYERSLLWNDEELQIGWPLEAGMTPVLAAKDAQGRPFRDADIFL